MITRLFMLAVFGLFSVVSNAAMNKQEITYQHDGVELRGYLFWDDAFEGKRPAVLVFHEWWGLNDYALLRAEMLAESGYVAFAADMYGDGKQTRHADDAKGWMQQITGNVDVWRARAELALQQMQAHEKVDKSKTAAVGYCFGGATVMQLAYTGTDIKGVISVHGSLPPASAEQAGKVKSRVLVLHGGSDGFIPKERIEKFSTALTDAALDWEMVTYGGAVHGFSNPYADGYGINGVAYNEKAEQRSWQRSLDFLEDLFASDH
jgi:dienelactone hydrolase